MKNLMSNALTKLSSGLKWVSVKQVVVALLAGVVLLTTTACSPPSTRVVGEGSYDKKVGQQTELYDPIQKPQGGMNVYSDVDPRTPTRSNDAQARELVDNARQNLKNRADDVEDLVENVKETPRLFDKSTRVTTEQARDKAGNLTKDVIEGTQRGVENLRDNAADAGRALRKLPDEVMDNARSTGEDLVSNVRDAANAAERSARSIE